MKRTQLRLSNLIHLAVLPLWLFAANPAFAQVAPMAYQGRLTEKGAPASGTYEMQFKLFDTPDAGTGTQQGSTITDPAVVAKDGVFTATLDFGVAVFDGSPRYLEISVKKAGSGSPLSTLAPRQAITPVPYAIHTLSAAPVSGGVQADASGNVAIGTNTFPPGVRLNVDGNARISTGGSGGYLQIGTPGGETGLSVIGSNRFDLRFDDSTLTLAAGTGQEPPGAGFGMTFNTNGSMGIGMSGRKAKPPWKLEVGGPTRILPEGNEFIGKAIQFSTPNGETGISLMPNGDISTSRADIRFDGRTLKLVAGPGNGPPGNLSGVAIERNGNVGVGTTEPVNKLSVAGNADFTGSVGIGTATPIAKLHAEARDVNLSAVYGNAAGVSGAGVYGKATALGGIGVYAQSVNGPAIQAEGHAKQARDKGGFVKAMVYCDPFLPADQYVVRCFNSQVSGLAPCATMVRGGSGYYEIDLGFHVGDRFISVTPANGSQLGAFVDLRVGTSGNKVSVEFRDAFDISKPERDCAFYLFVY